MHRHGYSGTKLHRKRDQREALIRGLANSLIQVGSIETTQVRAKVVVPYVEKLITKAKKNDLHNRRQIINSLADIGSAHKLVDEIAPQLGKRNSGYFRIKKTTVRRGDLTQLARIDFVDELKVDEVSAEEPAEKPAEAKSSPAKADKEKVATKAVKK